MSFNFVFEIFVLRLGMNECFETVMLSIMNQRKFNLLDMFIVMMLSIRFIFGCNNADILLYFRLSVLLL